MRIISNFKDYYDGTQIYGSDPRLVFKRTREEVLLEKDDPTITQRNINYRAIKIFNHIKAGVNYNIPYSAEGVAVLFCGEIWYGIRRPGASHTNQQQFKEHQQCSIKGKYATSFSYDELSEYEISLIAPTFDFLRHLDPLLDLIKNNPHPCEPAIENGDVTAAFEPSSRFNQIWITQKANLSDFQFYRVYDAFSAFQEISMWVGGVLPSNVAETDNISDSNLAKQKGFDYYSFRRRPWKHI